MTFGAENFGYPKLQIITIINLLVTTIVQVVVAAVVVNPAGPLQGVSGLGPRLEIIAPQLLWISLLLSAMVIAVSLGRLFLKVLNPLADREAKWVTVNNRILVNSCEQTLIFLLNLVAVTALLPADLAGYLAWAIPFFVIGRLLFWFGYLLHPTWRAYGVFWGYNLQMALIGAALYFAAAGH